MVPEKRLLGSTCRTSASDRSKRCIVQFLTTPIIIQKIICWGRRDWQAIYVIQPEWYVAGGRDAGMTSQKLESAGRDQLIVASTPGVDQNPGEKD